MGAEQTDAPFISMDPPEHNRYRRMISPGFGPSRLRALQDQIRQRVCNILDRLGARKECEFVTEVAAELPIQVLAELLGIPQEDRLKLFDWSNSMIAEDDPELRKGPEETAADVAAMIEYSGRLWEERVAKPGSDLISMLIHTDSEGDVMSKERYLGTFILLVAAGNETTRNSISGGLIALAQDFPSSARPAWPRIPRFMPPVLRS